MSHTTLLSFIVFSPFSFLMSLRWIAGSLSLSSHALIPITALKQYSKKYCTCISSNPPHPHPPTARAASARDSACVIFTEKGSRCVMNEALHCAGDFPFESAFAFKTFLLMPPLKGRSPENSVCFSFKCGVLPRLWD